MISSIVEGFLLPLVACFGILGNVTSICVLRDNRMEMKATFRFVKKKEAGKGYKVVNVPREILIMLAIFDTIFVVSATTTFSLPLLSTGWKVRKNRVCINIFLRLGISRNLFIRSFFPGCCPGSRYLLMLPSLSLH